MKNYFALFCRGGGLWYWWALIILSVGDFGIDYSENPAFWLLIAPVIMIMVAGLIFHLVVNAVEITWNYTKERLA